MTREQDARETAIRHLLGLIADRGFDPGDCMSPVGPDERCGECVRCWIRNVSIAAAALLPSPPATTGAGATLADIRRILHAEDARHRLGSCLCPSSMAGITAALAAASPPATTGAGVRASLEDDLVWMKRDRASWKRQAELANERAAVVAAAASAYLAAEDRRCGVCLGLSPSWDGHDVNPPCRVTARAALDALAASSPPATDGDAATRRSTHPDCVPGCTRLYPHDRPHHCAPRDTETGTP